MFRRFAGLALTTALIGATPASAEWRKAEGSNFIAYGDASEAELRRYILTLEAFDLMLRARMNMPPAEASARKLPIYLVGSSDIHTVLPHAGDIAGFYHAGVDDIFAVAIVGRSDDTLLHEYFHHFFFQTGAAEGYPSWLVEGLATYFGSTKVQDDRVVVGFVPESYDYMLSERGWPYLPHLLERRMADVPEGNRENFYPVSWLLTHWFMSTPERRRQLATYLQRVRQGTNSTEAMEAAVGMPQERLRTELRAYMRGRLRGSAFEGQLPNPHIQFTRLSKDMGDLMLLGQRLKLPMPEPEQDAALTAVRRAAARVGDEPAAQVILGRAELRMGDADRGVEILNAVLESNPEHVEAKQLLAEHHLSRRSGGPDVARARRLLAEAYRADPSDYVTLSMLARSRAGAAGYPSQNDLTTWSQAFAQAPQVPMLRLGYADAMIQAGEYDDAADMLEPLANAPHETPFSKAAQRLLEDARTQRAPTVTPAEAAPESTVAGQSGG